MQLVIHRGTKQIGGSCIELFYQGTRIVLDFGLPLDAPGDVNLKEHIPSTFRERLNNSSKSLSAVLLSHAHPDHYGLFKLLPSDVPVYCGQSTAKLISAASIFSNSQKLPTEPCIFRSNKPFMIPPFRITPKLMDHSAFDAHGFLIEAEGQSLFYTGDFRMHGR